MKFINRGDRASAQTCVWALSMGVSYVFQYSVLVNVFDALEHWISLSCFRARMMWRSQCATRVFTTCMWWVGVRLAYYCCCWCMLHVTSELIESSNEIREKHDCDPIALSNFTRVHNTWIINASFSFDFIFCFVVIFRRIPCALCIWNKISPLHL